MSLEARQPVIAGISGRYPNSDNLEQFWNNLMNGAQMCSVDDTRWPVGFMGLPKRTGKIKRIDRFDYEFFNVNEFDANFMDPQLRLLHETTYEAIWDAGIDPNRLRGSNTGVYVGLCYSDTDTALKEDDSSPVNYIQCEASRLSYAFDFRGPAVVVDTACASMFTALNEGLVALKNELCDNLIVAGAAVHLRYMTAAAFKNLRMISDDGKSKCLDERADGYCRSEAVVSIFIQRKHAAKRIYASIVSCKTNEDGYKQEGNHFPSFELQTKLMKETIADSGINPIDINYIEAHVTGTTAGDPIECKAILEAYRPNNCEKPLLFGCLKSNIGHTEGASGGCSITKAVLAFQRRRLPPNLNYQIPNQSIDGLHNGVIVPVLKPIEFYDNCIPINTFGFGGVNVHAILKANDKVENERSRKISNDLPRIVNVCGRTEESVESIMNYIEQESSMITNDFLALLNDVSKIGYESGLYYRGFMIIDEYNKPTKCVIHGCHKTPLCFAFLEEEQTFNIYKDIFKMKIIEVSFNVSCEIMKTVGIPLREIISNRKRKNVNNVTGKVLNAALIIALIEVLKFLGVTPSRIISSSNGEILSAFARGCINHRQALLLTFFAANRNQNGHGSMLRAICSQIIKRKANCQCGNICHSFNGPMKRNGSSTLSDALFSTKNEICVDAGDLSNDISIITFTSREIFENTFTGARTSRLYSPFYREDNSKSISISINSILAVIGNVYSSGHNPEIEKLYPKVEYPVACETASLSPLFKWNHERALLVTKYPEYFNKAKHTQVVKIDLLEAKNPYLGDHCIDDRILYPAAGYLQLAWQYFALIKGFDDYMQRPIKFSKVKFLRATILPKVGNVSISVTVNDLTGEFYIIENGSICTSGFIALDEQEHFENFDDFESEKDALELETKQIYKVLRIRGYDYGPSFRGLVTVMSDGSKAKIKWLGNWISFVDSLFQLAIFAENNKVLCVPTYIDYLRCDCRKLFHALKLSEPSGEALVGAYYNREINLGGTHGIIVKGLKATFVLRRQKNQTATVESVHHVPFTGCVDESADDDEEFNVYSERCLKHLNEIISSTANDENNDNDEVEHNDNEDANESEVNACKKFENGEQYALLSALNEAIAEKKSALQTLQMLRSKSNKELANDLIFKHSETQLFQPFIELIFENTRSKYLNVLEANISTSSVCETIASLFDFYDCYERNYVVIHSEKSLKVKKEIVNSIYKMKADESIIPNSITNLDIVIVKDENTTSYFSSKMLSSERLKRFLHSCYEAMNESAFLLWYTREEMTKIERTLYAAVNEQPVTLFDFNQVMSIMSEAKFTYIGKRTNSKRAMVLLFRKCMPYDLQPILIETKAFSFDWIETLKREVKCERNNKIWLLADEDFSGIVGFVNCLRKEPFGDRIRCFFNTSTGIDCSALLNDAFEKDLVMNIYKNGVAGSYRYSTFDENMRLNSEHIYLDVKVKGDLSSLKWIEAPHKHYKQLPETSRNVRFALCHVFYAALNFKDIMVASGRISLNAYPIAPYNKCSIGMEYAGVDENGNRVFGLCDSQSIASTLLIDKEGFNFSVPSAWTLEDAATVPVVYLTAYYALLIRAKLKANEKVLIHAGSGGVGQAAISLCLSMGCEVFTSVGTEEKKQFLMKTFPRLQEKHFTNSRDSSFEERILKETNGKGVDVILNCLAEEKLRASINCLAEFGRFVEIGKYDIIQNAAFNGAKFEQNKTFHVVCIAHLLHDAIVNRSKAASRMYAKLKHIFKRGLENGEIAPLKRNVFDASEAEEAFRFMASGKHIGKVVIKIRDEAYVVNGKPFLMKAIPQTWFHSSKSYIIIGGLGGFGLELASWMVDRGAKHIILTSRNGLTNTYQSLTIDNLRKNGASVLVSKEDAITLMSAQRLLEKANAISPVGGIFNLAMVLKDALFENQSIESFEEVCAPKIKLTLNFDELSRKMCPELDFFVCFSSITAGRGNAGQSNYGFANSAMERICEKRRADGYHGLAIQWGPIGDVGVIAERMGNDVTLLQTVPQRLLSCFEILDKFLQSSEAICSSIVKVNDNKSAAGKRDNLVNTICHILGIKNAANLDQNTTLGDLGMDSLMAVEIKQGLERDYDMVLSTDDIRKLSIKDLRSIATTTTQKKQTKKIIE